jgi:hypothetical protein
MPESNQEAEWRAEFERFGEEQVRSSVASGLFHEPKRQFAFRWLGDEALARRVEKIKPATTCAGHFFGGGSVALPGLSQRRAH